MNRSKLRSAWGLALAVLFGGSVAKAEPPPPPPVPGQIHTVYKNELPASPVPVAAKPDTLPTISQPPGMPVVGDLGKANHGANNHGKVEKFDHGAGAHNSHGSDHKGHGDTHNGHEAHLENDHNAFIVSGEYLFFQPRRREQDFAIVGRNPNWAPIGTIRNIDGNFDSGFRIGAGFHSNCGWEFFFNYTHYHSAADDFIPSGAGQQIFPTITHPAGLTQVASAKGENNINLNLFDFEFGKRIKVGEGWTLRGFAGPRYLNLDQKLTGLYTGGDVNTDFVRRRVEFDAYGLRAGGEVNYHFWEFFGVYARSSASMVVGQFRSSLVETVNGQTLVNVSEKSDKLVPIVDLGIGVSFQKGGCRITLGYEMANYFGVVEGIDFADDANPSKINRRWGDLGLNGFVVRTEFLF